MKFCFLPHFCLLPKLMDWFNLREFLFFPSLLSATPINSGLICVNFCFFLPHFSSWNKNSLYSHSYAWISVFCLISGNEIRILSIGSVYAWISVFLPHFSRWNKKILSTGSVYAWISVFCLTFGNLVRILGIGSVYAWISVFFASHLVMK